MKSIQTRVILGILLFPFSLLPRLTGSVEIELVEVPASEAAAASSLEQRVRPLTLSEQYATTQIGSIQSKGSEPLPVTGDPTVTIYQCGELLAKAPAGPDRAALVIELARRKAYLMIDGMMVLETPVAIPGNGKEVPLGWFPVSDRTRGSALSELYDVKPQYWLKLGNSAFGLHADDLSGYPAAGGCVRLPRPAIETVFTHVAEGTMVYICSTWLAPVPTGIATNESPSATIESPPATPMAVANALNRPGTIQPLPVAPKLAAPALDPAPPTVAAAPPATTEVIESALRTPAAEETTATRSLSELPSAVAATESVPAPATASAPKQPQDSSAGPQVVRLRNLLGGFAEKPETAEPTKQLTPVSGKAAAKPPVSRAPETTEVVRIRNLFGGQ